MNRCPKTLALPALFAALVLPTACTTSGTASRSRGADDSILLADDVTVLDAASSHDVTVLPDELLMPVATHPEIGNCKAGSVLVGDRARQGSLNPTGFLRRIATVEEEDGVYHIATTQAALTDVIRRGRIDVSIRTGEALGAGSQALQPNALGPGLHTQGNAAAHQDYDGVSLLDTSGTHTLVETSRELGYSVWATVDQGRVDFDSTIDIGANIEPGVIDWVEVVSSGSLTAELSLNVGLNLDEPATSAELSALLTQQIEEKAAWTSTANDFDFGTFSAGAIPIPVRGRSYASIDCALSFSGEADVTVGATAAAQLTAGYRYEDGDFHPVWDHSETLSHVGPDWTVRGDVSARCTMQPVFEVWFYDIPVAAVWSDAYTVLDSQAACQSGTLTGQVKDEAFSGLATSVGAHTEVFGLPDIEPTCPLFDVESTRSNETGSWPTGVGVACTMQDSTQASTAFEGPQATCFAPVQDSCEASSSPIPSTWTCEAGAWGDCVCDCDCGTEDIDCAVGECAGCEHDVCTIGAPLGLNCTLDGQSGACIQSICENDPYCCEHAWTLSCIDHVEKGHFACTPRTCPDPELPEPEETTSDYFQSNGVYYRDHGDEGYCSFVDSAELACQTGLAPAALSDHTVPESHYRGPCYVEPSCWSGKITVNKGDLVLRGEIAAVQGEERYLLQKHLAFLQSSAEVTDIYAPFWDDIETWDDTAHPLGHRGFWSEVEIATEDGEWSAPAGGTTVVLEPTALFHQTFDQTQVLQRYSSINSLGTEPFVGIFFEYLKWSKDHIGWMASKDIFAKWSQAYGLDLDGLPNPEVFVRGGAETDLLSPQFWDRDMHSGSRAAWSLIWGWHTKTGTSEVRDLFYGAPSMVAAVDTVFPARLAAWLEQVGFFTVKDTPAQVALRLKKEPTDAWQSNYLGRSPRRRCRLAHQRHGSGPTSATRRPLPGGSCTGVEWDRHPALLPGTGRSLHLSAGTLRGPSGVDEKRPSRGSGRGRSCSESGDDPGQQGRYLGVWFSSPFAGGPPGLGRWHLGIRRVQHLQLPGIRADHRRSGWRL